VDRAVQAVEMALDRYGAPVYVRRQIVHNTHVVSSLEKRGAIFVTEVDEVPPGAVVVFSAHGIAPEVRQDAERRGLRAIDATCPLVTKVHNEARRFAAKDYDILLVGHEGHEEVVGTAGEAPSRVRLVDGTDGAAKVEVRDPSKLVWLSQTTLSVDETNETVNALRERFPALLDPPSDDICSPPRTARPRSRSSRPRLTWSSSWVRRTRPTRSGWSRWPRITARRRRTWWMTPARSSSTGWTGCARSG
jgi:4-hydroxy-3-methylbut-2-enyl diphosphate reductase